MKCKIYLFEDNETRKRGMPKSPCFLRKNTKKMQFPQKK